MKNLSMPAEKLTSFSGEASGSAVETPAAGQAGQPVRSLRGFGIWGLVVAALVVCYSKPLYRLAWFAATVEFHSYILLVPFVSLYLSWSSRHEFIPYSKPDRGRAVLPLIAGIAVLACLWQATRLIGELPQVDYLFLATCSFWLFLLSICCFLLGKETFRVIAFPLDFLIFLMPLPTFLRDSVEAVLQHGSAVAAGMLFKLSGTPVLWNGLYFQLPGLSLEVATECSGIQSSMALLLTGLLAGYLFLRSPWKRAVLVTAVIPLGMLRNGLRIFTVGQLCVHFGSQMINSPIHRRGGPLFFALSLVPFLLLLFLLWRSERMRGSTVRKPCGT